MKFHSGQHPWPQTTTLQPPYSGFVPVTSHGTGNWEEQKQSTSTPFIISLSSPISHPIRHPGGGGGGSFAGRFRLRACAALWSACLPLLLFGCPLFRCRWPSPAGALGVGVGATLLSAAPSLVLLRTSVSATHCCCDVRIRRRAPLAGGLGGAGQCAAALCLSVGSIVDVVAEELQPNERGGAQVREEGVRTAGRQEQGNERQRNGSATPPAGRSGMTELAFSHALVVLLLVTGVSSKEKRSFVAVASGIPRNSVQK